MTGKLYFMRMLLPAIGRKFVPGWGKKTMVVLPALLAFLQCSGQYNDQNYDLHHHYPRNAGVAPVFITESPMNEATVQVFPDGVIKIYHTPDRESTRVLSISSSDGGYTWTKPTLLLEDSIIWQYPRRTLIDSRGNVHLLVFRRDNLDVLHTKTTDAGASWTPFVLAAKGRIGAIRGFLQTRSGRLIYAFHRRWQEDDPAHGRSFGSSVYSDDEGTTWVESESRLVAPVYENYIGNNYGFVEPNIVELQDGRIWMLARTQTGYLYQSFSADQGESWSGSEASIFHSSNSPANLLKLPDGRIVMTWCNTVDPDIATFGKIYTHRDVLHMAISEDDGRTWRGFREVMRIPTRNDQNDMPRGDSGTSYPNTSFTREGKIILVTGQGEYGGGRAIWIIDPKWLYQIDQRDDFSEGLEKWSCYTFTSLEQKPGRMLGPQLAEDPGSENGKVLHIRKEMANAYGDAAVWNFPMGRKGTLEMRIQVPEGSKGCSVALTDNHRHPNDPEAISTAMFAWPLVPGGAIPVDPGKWHTLELKWDLTTHNCEVFMDDDFVKNIPLANHSTTGISYVRFSSLAGEGEVDKKGIKIDWISSHSEQVLSTRAFE